MTLTNEERGTLQAIAALKTAIQQIDIAAAYNSDLYDLRDELIEKLETLEDGHNEE